MTLSRIPALFCTVVENGSVPALRVVRREYDRRPAYFGCFYHGNEWWITWADGNLLAPAEATDEAAAVIRKAMGL